MTEESTTVYTFETIDKRLSPRLIKHTPNPHRLHKTRAVIVPIDEHKSYCENCQQYIKNSKVDEHKKK